ncbi:MAG: amino acid adenylation domain-containing protein, partial [Caldilineaceae bacterium]
PLSYNQQAIWAWQNLVPESVAYNVAFTLHICSAVNISVLRQAIEQVVVRHPTLRAVYRDVEGQPQQFARATPEVDFAVVDAVGWSAEQLEATLQETYNRPFDLAHQVMRARLYVLAPARCVWQVVMHHIAVDGWSGAILLDEISRLYGLLLHDPAATLPPLPHKYDEFVTWQQDLLASAAGQKMRQFWHAQLAGEQPKLDLPTPGPGTSEATYAAARYTFQIDEELTAALRQLAQAEGSTPYSLLLAAFQVFLYRYTGQPRVQVGTPVLGRPNRDFARLVGDFSNLIVLRGEVDPADTFLHFLHQVTATVQNALIHQHYPFSLLSEELLIANDAAHSSPFQAALNLLSFPRRLRKLGPVFADQTEAHRVEYGGFTISRFDIETGQGTGRIDLSLDLFEVKENSINAYLDYNRARFDQATIQRMMGHFLTLLHGITRNPQQTIGALPLLSTAEEQQLMAWNATAAPLSSPALVHERFAQQAQRTPHQTALLYDGVTLSYDQLEQRANQLAHCLRQNGVGPAIVVGISLERPPDMMVALLGILKAGAICLPLHPGVPNAQLAFMLADARPKLVLTQRSVLERLPHTSHDAKFVCLDAEWSQVQAQSSAPPANLTGPDNLAYIVYTTSATEPPTGVMISHGSVVYHSQAVSEQFHLHPTDRFWRPTATNFDTALAKIWPTLLSGATLAWPGEQLPPVADLCALIQEHALTVLDLPTAYWRDWVRHLANCGAALPACLRLVVVGGEPVNIQCYRQWRQLPGADAVRWLNGYGATETTGVALLFAPDGAALEQVPLGRPLANTQAYILDANGQPAPIGVAGELYLGGAGLAVGYLNQPALTRDRFLPVPFTIHSDHGPTTYVNPKRLYKTGDRGRFLPDGNIEFLGRVADQVHIRGFPINLAVIQAALAQHPAVADCAVVVYSAATAAQQLVAYVVEQANAHPAGPGAAPSELRQWLRDKLPHYMIPASFVALPALPRTASFQIDYGALPPPTHEAVLPATARADMSETEALVARIWADVLHMAQVERRANFFDLGGHSLLATQVVSRIRQAADVSLSLRQLFEEPTVARLAAVIEQERRRRAPVALPPLHPMPRAEPAPLSFAQERMWFLQQLAPDNTAYHISLVVRLHSALNLPALEQALNAVAQRHESMRTIFPTKDGVPHQVILPAQNINLAAVDLTDIAADAQESYIIEMVNDDLRQPFDLAGAPAWRFTLYTCSPTEHVIYFAFHHIIFDQWSSAVLWQDLADHYRAYTEQRPPQVTPAPIQYADYAIWQRGWLQGATLDALLDYWRQQLAGAPVLDLPLDKPRPPLQSFRGATEFLAIPPALAQALRQVSSQMQVSPFMLLLAAFNVLLARYTGQEDIAIGVPVANRHHLDVESLIGTLVNTLVIRTDLSGEPNFAELLQRVRDVLLDAYAHQDLPFEKLVSEVVAKRDLSYTPLVQVLFNMVNTPFDYENVADLPFELVQFDRGAAQFDLSVTVSIDEKMPLEPQVAVEYNVELFQPATIRRVLRHYQTLLEAVTANPQQPIARYPILGAAEVAQLTQRWNQTAMFYPRQHCLHDLVAAQAQKTPHKSAVTFGDSSLTYQELDERSNQLAHYLQERGVGPETVVGVFVERSLAMVVGLLGILKAGGAYLPLDPIFPRERLAFMMADADVCTIVTSADLAAQAPMMEGGHRVCLDSDWPTIAQRPATSPRTAVQPSNLAYLIYTSGSTGQPKGVQIEHRNVVNFLTAMQQQPGLASDDVLLAVTTLSFDISILEIFLPLVSGAHVVVADRLTVVDGRELLAALRQHRVTVMQATPTTWSMLVEAGWRDTPTLRKVLCGGKRSRPLAAAILARRRPVEYVRPHRDDHLVRHLARAAR